jgi:hypothetical protein
MQFSDARTHEWSWWLRNGKGRARYLSGSIRIAITYDNFVCDDVVVDEVREKNEWS